MEEGSENERSRWRFGAVPARERPRSVYIYFVLSFPSLVEREREEGETDREREREIRSPRR